MATPPQSKDADRRFRRLEARERTTAPPPVAAVAGVLLGGLAALSFACVEATVTAAAGVTLPPMSVLPVVGAATVAVGAAIGGLTGVTGLWGARWASGAAVTTIGWLLAAPIAASVGGSGATIALVMATLAGIGLGQVAGRIPAPPWAHLGVAALAFVWFALAAPLHLHVVASTTSIPGLVVSGVAGVVALLAAALAALLTGDGRPPVIPLVLVGSAGAVGAYVLGPRAADTTWAAGTGEGPAIVLIDISGLRADRTGAGGYQRDVTPRLDRFARGALRFDQARATSNWSVPSLASVLTGRLPYSHGAGLHDGVRQTRSPMRPDLMTLSMALEREGWATAAAVADPELRTLWLDSGFDVWSDAGPWGAVPVLLSPIVAAGLDPAPWPMTVPAEQVTERALALMAQQEGDAWMLLVQYADAAGPFRLRPEDEQAVGFTTRADPHDRYDAALHRVDDAVGRLLEQVPADAWVVVLGDRGVHLTEERTAQSQGRPGARWGQTMYDELLRVPLWIRAPGVTPRRVPEVVSLVDVSATLLRGVGLEPISGTDGLPLQAAFGATQTARAAVAQSSYWGVERQAVVLGRYKVMDVADGKTPMFDLQEDPRETAPLRTGSDNDKIERQMLGLLPPAGAGWSLQDPPSVTMQVGRLLTRFVE